MGEMIAAISQALPGWVAASAAPPRKTSAARASVAEAGRKDESSAEAAQAAAGADETAAGAGMSEKEAETGLPAHCFTQEGENTRSRPAAPARGTEHLDPRAPGIAR